QQLPTLTQLDGFLAAQQMGITQLAVSYCNALVGDSSPGSAARDNLFGSFNFNAQVSTAFNSSGRTQIIEPILGRLLGTEINGTPLNTQADPALLRDELNSLITIMTTCGNNCAAGRTYTVVKATCAAALGSAVMLIQ
ncbi:MAG TPA: LamG domain-containing protein, partial [Cellvibrionaceae bacterium]